MGRPHPMAGRLPTEAEGLRRRLRTLEFQRQLEEERYRLQQRQAQEMEALRRGLAKQLTGGGTPSRDVQAMYYQVKAKVAGGYFADAYDVLNAAKYAEQQDQAVKEAAALDSAEAIVPAARMVEKHRVELIKMQRDQVERSKKFHEALFLDPARQAERSRVHTPEPPPARVSRLGAPPSARGAPRGPRRHQRRRMRPRSTSSGGSSTGRCSPRRPRLRRSTRRSGRRRRRRPRAARPGPPPRPGRGPRAPRRSRCSCRSRTWSTAAPVPAHTTR